MADGTSSETKNGIQSAILGVMSEVGVIGKNRKNEKQDYNFRGIDDVVERVGPLLAKHGITCMPTGVSNLHIQQVETKNSRMMHVTAIFEHTYEAKDGSKRIVQTLGEAMDTGDKASNKAMSAALKYAHTDVFQIPTFGKDADIESQSPELVRSATQSTTQRPASSPQRSPGTPRPAPKPDSGALLPNYGRLKGQPIAGANVKDLEFYANGCRRSIADPAKARWIDKERATLAAIEMEIARQTGAPTAEEEVGQTRQSTYDEPPPHTDDDQPF